MPEEHSRFVCHLGRPDLARGGGRTYLWLLVLWLACWLSVGYQPCEKEHPMSAAKKQVRERFRDAVLTRAKYRCEIPNCGFVSSKERPKEELDPHHITDRNQSPNGGFVAENGIALCSPCHVKAEVFHSTGVALEGFAPDDLYRIIGSSYEAAMAASRRLKGAG